VSRDGETWFLLNASPEIRAQIESFPPLYPRGPRHSPIAGVVLTNGDLDHCLGLFSLREWQPLRLYATRAVHDGLVHGNAMARTLARFDGQLRFTALAEGQPVPLARSDGEPSGLTVEAVPAAGKLPIHLVGQREPSPEDNVGLLVRDEGTGTTLAYFTGVTRLTPAVERAVERADTCLFDGTFWSEDELPASGLGTARAEQMGHWPLGGAGGSLEWLASRARSDSRRSRPLRSVFLHINNTNPILVEDSPEAAAVNQAGVEIAFDGMELPA
jgi:pyrroloquinoline quinone biosynthesis protein B